MARLIIMRGLPASGKSTQAKKIAKQSGNAIRLNRDLLREMLHFGEWSGRNEEKTIEATRELAKFFLKKYPGHKVIVDDTNLNKGTLQSWKDLAKELDVKSEVITLDTSVEECIARDRARTESVGSNVIINMARKNGFYLHKRKDVIVDLDGTLCDTSGRVHYVQQEKKDWENFFKEIPNDPPRLAVVERVRILAKDYNIVLVSARPDHAQIKKDTQEWLQRYQIPYETLIMRPGGNSAPDEEIKQKILNDYLEKEQIELVIDDRPKVIRMWRANGLTVEDVGSGEEF